MKYLMQFLGFMEICDYRFDHGSGKYIQYGEKYSDFYTYFAEVYGLFSMRNHEHCLNGKRDGEGRAIFSSRTEDEFVSRALFIALTSLIADLQCRRLAMNVYLCCLARDYDSVDQLLITYFSRVAGRVRVSLLY